MANITYAILAILPLVAWYLYVQARRWRFKKYAHIPHLPSSFALGHLKFIAEGFKKLGDSRRHGDYVFGDMIKAAGNPQILMVDLRPVNYAMVLVASHDIAEQITRTSKLYPYSVTKSPTIQISYQHLVGAKSILTLEGEEWKTFRKRFNLGFAPQHLLTLLPQIVKKTSDFMSRLDSLAESGVEFDMEPLCTDLTFDIIGAIVMNVDFEAQGEHIRSNNIVKHYRNLIETFSDTGRLWLWLNVPIRIRRIIASMQADRAIKKAVKQQFAEIKAAQRKATKQTKDRSVLALALEDIDVLTSDTLQSITDQVKTFLFAGHDTTSILLQRLFYVLSIHPKCLATLRAEHDAIFGDADPQEVFLARPDETIRALSYTSACIKEALRLWPPAGTARRAEPGSGFKVRLENGEEVCLDGAVLYLCQYLIQRDPKVYGETANQFIPERWLGDTDTSAANKDEAGHEAGESKIPISAWRAFERGPRNCIGQELANLEARVILACVIRRYDFIKVGAGAIKVDEKGEPVMDIKGVYETTSELFSSMQVTSKPFDKTRMRIKMHHKDN
ncbi:cytochrome P450 [Lindgomyces ingoldianus]|uniref:Cytochrome P450 n=1 Tax=Lindgomyces ingoldianus TaxID=673940 RepID=A0ACB6R595_9PLEO|nr:cytochrome P450 [Lindgomyces ingoldianus]KAF2474484.1 cytochrome P450 [Lindgomyces ingoldianus]